MAGCKETPARSSAQLRGIELGPQDRSSDHVMGNKAGRDNQIGPRPQLSMLAESAGKMGDCGGEGP
ncbi:hypothetical protein RHGRI_037224 [Rhododendron griersonianum]|uniref:Uncharacterized protein n=1 Tax=Rhododendron griersonianum TaxID=479676 RepID=A0AAV6HRG2_9ERIC|nr:hypothetical protein RHGRI_037224 [Rhododendron griersonianum]